MAKHKEHKKLTKELLGKEHADVHKLMDAPAKIVGPRHRKFLHDKETVAGITILKGPEKGAAAALHIIHDKIDSGIKKELKKALKKVTK